MEREQSYSDKEHREVEHIEENEEERGYFVRQLPSALKYEAQLVVAQDDYVVLYGRYEGLSKNLLAADIVRMKDGILVEHWCVVRDEPTREESLSGMPAFGDASPIN